MRKLEPSETALIKEYIDNDTEIKELTKRLATLNTTQGHLKGQIKRAFGWNVDFVTVVGDKASRIVIDRDKLQKIDVFDYRVSE